MKKIFLLVGGFLVMFNVNAESRVINILCFGDSITQGTYINKKYEIGNSWVNILQGISNGKLKTINAGLSGRKTADKEELLPYLKEYKNIDCVIIFLGVNDLCISKEKVLKNCIENINWMIKKIRNAYRNVNIILLSSPGLEVDNMNSAFLKLGFDGKEQKMLDRYRKELKVFAVENDCNYIDLWGLVSLGNYTDGLHPNMDGQKQVADCIWEKLKEFSIK